MQQGIKQDSGVTFIIFKIDISKDKNIFIRNIIPLSKLFYQFSLNISNDSIQNTIINYTEQ